MKQVHIRRYTNGLSKKDKSDGKETSITFDIIAGTSIGAMNGSSTYKLCYRKWYL